MNFEIIDIAIRAVSLTALIVGVACVLIRNHRTAPKIKLHMKKCHDKQQKQGLTCYWTCEFCKTEQLEIKNRAAEQVTTYLKNLKKSRDKHKTGRLNYARRDEQARRSAKNSRS